MKQEEIKNKVEQKINQLVEEFRKYPEKFLTEEDIRSHLYHFLMSDFNTIQNCEDNTKSIPVHCEVRWYGNSGRLKLRSDIVILEVSTLRTKDKVPSKGYGFNKLKVIVEIKLRRKIGQSDKSFKEKISKDREKILRIKRELNSNFNSYLLIFDKKKNLEIEHENTNNHKEFYIYPYVNSGSLRR